MDDWQVGSFGVIIKSGDSPVREYQVAGWIKGVWALDFRAYSQATVFDDDCFPGWCLTHVPTGLVAGGILAPIHQAQLIAEEVDAVGDWGFTEPAKAKGMGPGVRKIRDRHDGTFVTRSSAFGPFSFAREAVA